MYVEPTESQLSRAWQRVLVANRDLLEQHVYGMCFVPRDPHERVRVSRGGYLPVRVLAAAIGKGALTHRPSFVSVSARCKNPDCCNPQHLDLRWYPPGGFDRDPESLAIAAAYAAWTPLKVLLKRFPSLSSLNQAHRIVHALQDLPKKTKI